jgi:hypothetical protein
VREHFHAWSWEYGKIPDPPLKGVDWEDPSVLSVIVMREPMERSLAGDGWVNKNFGAVEVNRTLEQWWGLAESYMTNNFALDRLTAANCAFGENTGEACLDEAKALLSRFTVVLDTACLTEGLEALEKLLGFSAMEYPKERLHHKHPSVRDRLPNEEIYNFIERRMQRDIELYNFSKTLRLVDCDAIATS